MNIDTQDFSPTPESIEAELDRIESDIEQEIEIENGKERSSILLKIRKLHQELTQSEEAC